MKPKIFIASSAEGLSIAYGVQENLEYDAECTVWSQGVFTPSAYPVDDLVEELNISDFGIFVFSPDDVVTMRKEEKNAVRDNVVLELGLFIGRLGRKRNFMISPKDADLHLPTDLAGLSPLTFEPERRDGNMVAALGTSCNKIRGAVRKQGLITGTVEQVVGGLDEKCIQLMAIFGRLPFFSAPIPGFATGTFTNQSFDHAVSRLLRLKVLRFDLSVDGKQYAYHWTDLGKTIVEKYGYDKERPAPTFDTNPTENQSMCGLSDEAVELLLEAVKDKNGRVMSIGTMQGYVVQTNGRNFTEALDAEGEAMWKGAVEELFENGFLEDRAGKGEVFSVTSKGFKVAEKLKPQE